MLPGAKPAEHTLRSIPEIPGELRQRHIIIKCGSGYRMVYDRFELFNQVKRLKPDLVLSHAGAQGHLAKAGVALIQLFDVEKACFGYTGIFRPLKRKIRDVPVC